VNWHPDGEFIASGDIEGKIQIWGASQSSTMAPGGNDISFSPDGHLYASALGNAVIVCNVLTRELQSEFDEHDRPIFAVAWSPDGEKIAASSTDGVILIRNAATGAVLSTTNTAGMDSSARIRPVLSWSPDSRRLAFSLHNNSIRIVDAATSETLYDLKSHTKTVLSLAFSPDGLWLASCADDERLNVWNSRNGNLEKVLCRPFTGESPMNAISWDPNSLQIATAGVDTLVHIWDVATGNRLYWLAGHNTYVQSVAWSPDGRRIASTDQNGSVHVWDPIAAKETLVLSYPGAVHRIAWTPDGTGLMAAGYDGPSAVRCWSAKSETSSGGVLWTSR
jgi:WD40 repeat protein